MIKLNKLYTWKKIKQELSHGLVLEKLHKIIKFNQKAWLKSYINMTTDLRKKAKNDFEKYFFKLMNNAAFGITMEKCERTQRY